jgi:DNA-binding MarR family transcriptional regulator
MMNIALANGDRFLRGRRGQEPVDDVSGVLLRLASALQDLQMELKETAESSRCQDLGTVSEVRLHAATDSNLQLNVRRARSIRQLRKSIFGAEFFSGPPWDILLLLFESHACQRRDTVCNVYDDTEIAPATALRWINKLSQAGLVRLRDDPLDGRRRFVELSNCGVAALTEYFVQSRSV